MAEIKIKRRTLSFAEANSRVKVSAILLEPGGTERILVLAHGAGSGIKSPFMEKISMELASLGIATFRFNFPYMETGRRMPNPASVSAAAVRSAVKTAAKILPGAVLLVGGNRTAEG